MAACLSHSLGTPCSCLFQPIDQVLYLFFARRVVVIELIEFQLERVDKNVDFVKREFHFATPYLTTPRTLAKMR